MSRRIAEKWRPSLALILGSTVAAVLALPFVGIIGSRLVGRVTGYFEAQVLFGGLIVVVAAILAWVLWRILYGPIRALSHRADKIKRGVPGALEPLQHYGTEEMQTLGQSMLDMGRVLQGREAVLRSYADHVTHELKSPLTVIRGAAELLSEGGLPEADRDRMIGRIEAAAARMARLLDAQRALAQAQEPLGDGVASLSRVLAEVTREHRGLTIKGSGEVEVPMPVAQLHLVLGHLLSNAEAHGAAVVTVMAAEDGFDLRDDGPGISTGNRDRVFDPFFTTRREAGGTGMGLAIVRRMLEAHGAEITLSADGPGTGFEVRF